LITGRAGEGADPDWIRRPCVFAAWSTDRKGEWIVQRILVPHLEWQDPEALGRFMAAAVAGHGATVRCMHVRPIPSSRQGKWGRIVATAEQEMERFRARAVDELKIVEALLPGIPVETVVRFGDAKQEILIDAEAWSADLIAIMAGNGGRAVARRVVRRGAAPVMLYQPPTPSRSDVFLRGLEWVVAKGLSGTEVIGLGGRS
jgi:nucleotide-binding universal stress UspA family protein